MRQALLRQLTLLNLYSRGWLVMRNKYVHGQQPIIRKPRSRFDLSAHHKTTLNVGQLVPFYLQEIYPGDTFKVDTTFVARVTSSFLKPVIDNLFLDMYYFFVPNRLTFSDWALVMGENKSSYWARTNPVSVPTATVSTVTSGSIADYMGLPVGTLSVAKQVNALPFRAFALVYNEWFRNQNTTAPVNVPISASQPAVNGNAWSVNNYMGMPPYASKLHDYFTSCLPAPQKGGATPINIGGLAPVYPQEGLTVEDFDLTESPSALTWYSPAGGMSPTTGYNLIGLADVSANYLTTYRGSQSTGTSALGTSVYPNNLIADLGAATGSYNVNDLRFAFQLQKMLEKDARGGTRYSEYLLEHFGVNAGDARLQRPEFLAGSRSPINVQQVAQTSQSSDGSPLANVAAYSLSNGTSRFSKSFVEHGFVIGVCVLRYYHTYQQGIERFWRRSNRTDYYDPVFAHIGEQPVYTDELYAPTVSSIIFGYNEAWADLRYKPSRISGDLRSAASEGLDVWHFGDYYSTAPYLTSAWMQEQPSYVDRTLSVSSSVVDQYILDIYSKVDAVRALPTYSVPSLIDHN
ncbi:major capsid protein [Tortoise microvirus 51]|nr:major capsid protein [Tortoise microvirus 51]QCS37206.1 major capsid protein [Tortoise microvirus 53]